MDAPIPSMIYKRRDALGYHLIKVYRSPDILKYIVYNAILRQKRKQDGIYAACAPEGGGKSNFTLLAYSFYCDLSGESPQIENITRNVDELLERYAIVKRNGFVTLDESQELASDRHSERKAKDFKEKVTVMRERAFIQFLCFTNPLKTNNYVREDRLRGVFIIVKPGVAYFYANSVENPHFTTILESWDKFNKTRSIKRFTSYCPDFIMYYPEYVGPIREMYDKRKDENISKVLERGVELKKIPDGYLTVGEAAKYMHVSNETITKWTKSGKVGCIVSGVRKYIPREDLDSVENSVRVSKLGNLDSNDATID